MGATVQTRYGALRGVTVEGVTRFLGVPYAASPTGRLRFRAPEPPETWSGVRDAVAFGPTPPKPPYPEPFETLLAEPDIPGDDWLNLNIWTPDPDASGLPVLVWIHGGAFANGTSSIPMYDGGNFARHGVVLVSINYRLGAEGFALLPDAPANRGLLDQIAALEWVRDNISAFGGDPGNVTICGESAGAMSVVTLLTMPRAAGLFSKAIAQSGATQAAVAPDDAALVTAELGTSLAAAELGRAAAPAGDGALGSSPVTASGLAAHGIPAMLAAQADVRDALARQPDPARFGASVVASSIAFPPVVDGDSLPAHPLAAIAAGAGSSVPLLIGTNAEEFRLFLVAPGTISLITDEALAVMADGIGATGDVVELYRANRPGASPGDVLAALLTDRYFWQPALAVAEARGGGPAATYFYEFAWGSPLIGAGHAVEIPFVFDNLAAKDTPGLIGESPPQDLAERMHGAWVRFAESGDPGWPAFGADRQVQVFDSEGGVIGDPRRDEREIWPSG